MKGLFIEIQNCCGTTLPRRVRERAGQPAVDSADLYELIGVLRP